MIDSSRPLLIFVIRSDVVVDECGVNVSGVTRARSRHALATCRKGSTPIKWLAAQDMEAWIDRYDTFLFDCDGVIWLDTEPVANVPETLAILRKRGKRILFVSNNATKHR